MAPMCQWRSRPQHHKQTSPDGVIFDAANPTRLFSARLRIRLTGHHDSSAYHAVRRTPYAARRTPHANGADAGGHDGPHYWARSQLRADRAAMHQAASTAWASTTSHKPTPNSPPVHASTRMATKAAL